MLLPHDVLRHLPAVDDRDLHDAVERRIDACGLDALRLWPDCPQHTNQCLQYWLGVKLARCSPRRRPHHERQDADPRPRPQWGAIDGAHYRSVDGGPRLMRSVLFYRSEYGQAEHPTQKPVAVCMPLIEYSCRLAAWCWIRLPVPERRALLSTNIFGPGGGGWRA